MATMNVSLPRDVVEFVEHEVAGGGYGSSTEVVREALRLLRHEKAGQVEKVAILQREIGIGVEAANAGRFSRRGVGDILDEVKRESRGLGRVPSIAVNSSPACGCCIWKSPREGVAEPRIAFIT